MDDKQRIALVETKSITNPNDDSAEQLVRYQFGNHLGSASLELNDNAVVISYEEYYPYGSTSYQAVNKDIKAAAKRYRYTGKERDEESGLYYHGARYYAPWLGRWVSIDPIESINLYCYALCCPTRFFDPTGRDPVIGPYSKKGPNGEAPVSGDHIHQVASRTQQPGAARTTAPQFKEALSVSTKDPIYNDKRGQQVERAINHAQSVTDYDGRPADVPTSPTFPR